MKKIFNDIKYSIIDSYKFIVSEFLPNFFEALFTICVIQALAVYLGFEFDKLYFFISISILTIAITVIEQPPITVIEIDENGFEVSRKCEHPFFILLAFVLKIISFAFIFCGDTIFRYCFIFFLKLLSISK